jgi:hypothetical protein
MEIPVAWNSAMPIPPGFTKKATNEYGGTKPAASAAPVNNSLVPRKTGDDSDTGGGGGEPTTTATPFNYRKASIEALKSRYDNTKKYGRAIGIGSLFLGPIGTVIGIATKANYGIVKRRIEIELDTRIKENKITDEDLGTEKNPSELAVFIEEVSTKRKLTKAEQEVADKEGEPGSLNFKAFMKKQGRGLFNVAPDQKGLVDKALDAFAQNAADKIAEEVLNNQVDGTPTFSGRSSTKPKLKGLEKVTALKAAQDFATTKRLEKEREIEAAREAARKAAQAAAAARSRANRIAKGNITKDESGDGGFLDVTNPPPASAPPDKGGFSGGSSSGGSSSGGSSSGGPSYSDEAAGDYDDDSTGIYKGGLIKKPKVKSYANGGYVTSKTKKTTQRRKGLGTRP